ncbi:MAG: extensin family protein [Sphingomonas bacterium]|nr:extensin family protein [Sphingomonas bacterium]
MLLVVAVIEGAAFIAAHPQDVPWTRLDLDQPIGRFTGPKLAALGEDRRRCLALLTDSGVNDRAVPASVAPAPCGYADGVRLDRSIDYRPARLVTACPVAAALALWERDILQPAAMRHFGQQVTAIDHAGSYSCRRIAGRDEGSFSEHATADAVDILGFRLADGRSVSIVRDWNGDPSRAAFLREVRDGGCDLFSTALSPDYNAAHADHLHFDQAARGAWGGRLCN